MRQMRIADCVQIWYLNTSFSLVSVYHKRVTSVTNSVTVYFKPYESNGEAWRITFARTLWALIIFQLFMTGLFSLRTYFWASAIMVPLIVYTLWKSWMMWQDFGPLSEYLAISSICEVQRGEGVHGILGVDSVSRSQR